MTGKEAALKLTLHHMQCGMLMPIEWVKQNGEGSELSEVFRMATAALREQDVPDKNVVKTNADHIRSMTDDALAEFIYYHKQEACSCCELTETDGSCTETLCVNATLRWLK